MRIRLAAICAVLIVVGARDARAGDCYQLWSWIGYSQIPVWIHPDLAENMVHMDGTPWTDSEVMEEVKYAVETLQENLPSNAPKMIVQDSFSSGVNWDDAADDTIHITPRLQGGPCAAYDTGIQFDDPAQGVVIEYKRSGQGYETQVPGQPPVALGLENCGKRFEHFLGNDALPNHSFRALLTHELVHALGSHHYNDLLACSTIRTCYVGQPCSVVDGNEDDGEFYESPFLFDAKNLIDRYGAFPDNKKHRESSNGTSWSDKTPIGSAPLMGLSSSNSSTMGFIQKPGSTLLPYLYSWSQPSASYTYVGPFASGAVQIVLSRIGSAFLAGSFYGAFFQDESDEDPRKDIEFGRYSGGVLTSYSKNLDYRQQGISAAYDERSGRIVLAYRETNGTISVTTVSIFGVFSAAVPNIGSASTSDAPSVSCGPASISYNCVVAWAHAPKASGAIRDLRWMQFETDGTTYTWGSLKNHGYQMYGSPSVAYKGSTSSTCAFLFAWKNPGNVAYTRCKPAGQSAGLTSATEISRSVPSGKRVMSPTLGASNGSAELIMVWK